MARLNVRPAVRQAILDRPEVVANHEGGIAFKVDPEMELYLRACTALIEDKFYTKADQELAELQALIRRCDRRYVLQLANYVRNAMHLRSFPMILLAEAASMELKPRESKADVRAYTPKILRRADEPAEVLAYWLARYGGETKTIPHALAKGIADTLSGFDEYELSKYDRSGSVKLRDVLRLVRPTPKDEEQAALWKRAKEGTLATPRTWETYISEHGSSAEAWNEIAPDMGIMALIRNLRNFEEKGAQRAIEIAIQAMTDPERVRKSKLLPFRWFQAAKNVTSNRLKDAIHQALDLSLESVEPWQGKTAIFSDNSGSMHDRLSAKGKTLRIEVAALMSAMAVALSPEDYRVGVFGASFAWVPVSRRDSVLTNMHRIAREYVGHATNAYLSIQALRKEKILVDRVLIFSDMQCYDTTARKRMAGGYYTDWHRGSSLVEEWALYRREVNPNAILYSIDLAGYGTAQFLPDKDGAVLLAGWSDRVLDLVRQYERGGSAVEEIKAKW